MKTWKSLSNSRKKPPKKSYERSLAEAKRSQMISLGMLVIGLLLGILLWLLVSRSVNRPLDRLRDAVKQLASGKLDYEVPHSDYGNEVGDLARAVTVLQTEAQQMEAQRWIKTHIAAVSTELQAATSFSELSQTFLSSVAPLLKVGHAVFYLYEEEQRRLQMLGGYAFRERKNLDTYFAVGQGLVGQCALERAPIIITKPPADYIRIGSSLGEAVPKTIAVLPVLHNDQLLAVIELATFESLRCQRTGPAGRADADPGHEHGDHRAQQQDPAAARRDPASGGEHGKTGGQAGRAGRRDGGPAARDQGHRGLVPQHCRIGAGRHAGGR